MTHDQMCPSYGNPPWFTTCQCELIVKVRANEKAKWTHTCPDNNCCNGSPN